MTYPTAEASKNDVTRWKKKFKCVGGDDLIIWGDFNSENANQFMIVFDMCDPANEENIECKSEA